jgi:hypothetical protein
LPNAGFSRAITLTVLPHTLTGTWTGTWIRLPDRKPGELAAVPWAVLLAAATPPAAAIRPVAATVTRRPRAWC